jgi:hypothetical protein
VRAARSAGAAGPGHEDRIDEVDLTLPRAIDAEARPAGTAGSAAVAAGAAGAGSSVDRDSGSSVTASASLAAGAPVSTGTAITSSAAHEGTVAKSGIAIIECHSEGGSAPQSAASALTAFACCPAVATVTTGDPHAARSCGPGGSTPTAPTAASPRLACDTGVTNRSDPRDSAESAGRAVLRTSSRLS